MCGPRLRGERPCVCGLHLQGERRCVCGLRLLGKRRCASGPRLPTEGPYTCNLRLPQERRYACRCTCGPRLPGERRYACGPTKPWRLRPGSRRFPARPCSSWALALAPCCFPQRPSSQLPRAQVSDRTWFREPSSLARIHLRVPCMKAPWPGLQAVALWCSPSPWPWSCLPRELRCTCSPRLPGEHRCANGPTRLCRFPVRLCSRWPHHQ